MIAMTTPTRAAPLAEWRELPQDSAPSWLRELRRKALARFNELGLPSVRHENWRFTNIAPLRQTAFRPADDSAQVTRDELSCCGVPGLETLQAVFVNGRFVPELSDLAALPASVRVLGLAQALANEPSRLREHLGRIADIENHAFTALNTAMATDGLVLIVPRGVVVEAPIHLLHLTASAGAGAIDEPLAVHPRNLIIAEAGSSVTVIEDYAAINDEPYLTNAVTEFFVGDNADCVHYLLEREGKRAYNVSTLHVRQGRDSRFTSHSALLGGAIVRNNVYATLAGEGCWSLLNGLYVIGGEQVVDNHMKVDHAAPRGQSRQVYRGIMHDRSHGVFRGRIVVQPDAQQTDAKQKNQNLLLSPDATANTDPQLEIYADDVKCTHGATVGQIDERQVFYLRTRGIDEETARGMIIYAFAAESLGRMKLEPVRALLLEALSKRLPAGRLFRVLQ